MINVLFFFYRNAVSHSGGPAGYLLPFVNNENSFKDLKISFLDDVTRKRIRIADYRSEKNGCLGFFDSSKKLYQLANDKKQHTYTLFDLSKFDIVYFHRTIDYYYVRDSLKGNAFKTIIQSHSPVPPFIEFTKDCVNYRQKLFYGFNKWVFKKCDKYVFKNADFIIFPCKESEESYISKWFFYRHNLNQLSNKTKYIITGQSVCDTKIDYNLRNHYNINKDALVVLFYGRHNKRKGYDLVKSLGRKYKNRNDIYFIICGQYNTRFINHYTNWIELGFVNNIFSIIKQSDIYINANKDTYFDLCSLEVLSCGVTGMFRKTGGNKYLLNSFKSNLFGFETKREAITIIDKILKNRNLINNKDEIIKVYNEHFSEKQFIKTFEKTIKDIYYS